MLSFHEPSVPMVVLMLHFNKWSALQPVAYFLLTFHEPSVPLVVLTLQYCCWRARVYFLSSFQPLATVNSYFLNYFTLELSRGTWTYTSHSRKNPKYARKVTVKVLVRIVTEGVFLTPPGKLPFKCPKNCQNIAIFSRKLPKMLFLKKYFQMTIV